MSLTCDDDGDDDDGSGGDGDGDGDGGGGDATAEDDEQSTAAQDRVTCMSPPVIFCAMICAALGLIGIALDEKSQQVCDVKC